ncbi:flavin reductase family protein [Mesonia maritima]|uniref:Flavin reductase (DIM6/NTAB) family NADH-FMN oxidoreductase RutF n=1 Tax=Mesonia maritima TaxID=1793873 RepID=A0ABU1K6J5_9FLAO|nr:flavin reductase [Mesonia maritima]MDR6301235.1 flavin reductase (DIM6/NTAB) family NADH-FMN oxidoreductase RutF [Mesonia maritima]
MEYLNREKIEDLEKLFRVNLINSLSGYKSANLIATKSKDEITNVAIFSSVIHLGSNPPLLGFILRPTSVDRNTYDNLVSTQQFTVNHVHKDIIEEAHHTSAKYDGTVSEFNKTNLTEEYKKNFYPPFVKEAKIQIGCKMVNYYFIKENDCRLIIGEIEHLFFDENIQQEDGWLNLEKAESVAINGLDGYAETHLLDRFAYARPDEKVTSISNEKK